VEIHRCDAVRLLDVPHAAEHLRHLLEALHARVTRFRLECLHAVSLFSHIVVQPL
jgi:hypothetical protein